MKVALFVSELTPQVGGGYTYEKQLLEATLRLTSESKHTYFLYVKSKNLDDATLLPLIEPNKVISLYRSKIEKLKSKLFYISKAIFYKLRNPRHKFKVENHEKKFLLKSLELNKIDLILSLVPGTPTEEYPYITVVWDLQHRIQPYFPEVSQLEEWANRDFFYNLTLKKATYIITGTNTGKLEIQNFFQIPQERIKIIPFFTPRFPVYSVEADKITLIKYNIPHTYLFYPAQFWPHKNHINLLLAVKHLKEKYNLDLPLILVGSDKGNEKYVRSKAEEFNLLHQVHFLGFVPQVDMPALYRNALALTFLSFFGPDNLPPLEAMSLGCPVIASNVNGAVDQLGDAALLVDSKSYINIALSIKLLHENSDLRQDLKERGLKRANSWYSEDYAKEIFKIIDEFEPIRQCWESNYKIS